MRQLLFDLTRREHRDAAELQRLVSDLFEFGKKRAATGNLRRLIALCRGGLTVEAVDTFIELADGCRLAPLILSRAPNVCVPPSTAGSTISSFMEQETSHLSTHWLRWSERTDQT